MSETLNCLGILKNAIWSFIDDVVFEILVWSIKPNLLGLNDKVPNLWNIGNIGFAIFLHWKPNSLGFGGMCEEDPLYCLIIDLLGMCVIKP